MTTVFSALALTHSLRSTSFTGSGIDYATALYCTSLATTVYCTGMILYRIHRVVNIHGRELGLDIRTYQGVIGVIVETSSLYCVATLFALIAYIRGGPPSEYAWVFWTSTTGIAPTLIVARVTTLHARPDKSWADLCIQDTQIVPGPRPQLEMGRPASYELDSTNEATAPGKSTWPKEVEAVVGTSRGREKLDESISS
ncbi:hypothetical protein BDZ94DRAFT_1271816 [Collybia nuda]|uniref:Uncharacterized protein n=1 Tax=Collybia nuda TaxID=64659 RepID=A0A9P6CA19_9AGAR|nr:hypothetical protein BDZ94DRAFT_1271816 [Collybia nuda]